MLLARKKDTLFNITWKDWNKDGCRTIAIEFGSTRDISYQDNQDKRWILQDMEQKKILHANINLCKLSKDH